MGGDGLSGCDKLSKTDHIIIFFTRNAKKIDMSEIANHGEAELDMIEVPAGKQSADIHIGSYLGYLAGLNKGKDVSVVIVSKDTDFDNVIKFWEKTGVKASRAKKIKVVIPKAKAGKQTALTKKSMIKVNGDEKTKLNQEVMQAVRGAGYAAEVANSVAQLATKNYGGDCFMNEVHNALREKYTDYLEVYKAIKPVLSKYADANVSTVQEAEQTNTVITSEIEHLLSKAGFEAEDINYVASTVDKNTGEKNGKQQIYRTIISKYGQNKGLNIYNHIKKHI